MCLGGLASLDAGSSGQTLGQAGRHGSKKPAWR
jgi:hypothetical protein